MGIFIAIPTPPFAPWLDWSESVRSNQKLDRSAKEITSLRTKMTTLHVRNK